MNTWIHLMLFCGGAFVTLAMAVVLLGLYCSYIGNDLVLRSLRQEAVIAGVAALIEGGSVWAVLAFVPLAARALVLPGIFVAILYKATHLEDWGHAEVLLLLVFQLTVGATSAFLLTGHFVAAMAVAGSAAVVLIAAGSFLKGI